jgi:hypothetical protein
MSCDQDGVISRVEASGCGMTGGQLRHLIRPGGPWQRPRPGVRVLPTTRMPEFIMASGAIRFTLAARAVADAGQQLSSFRDCRAVAAGAVQRRRCTLDDLANELAGMPRRYSGWLREALAEVADGVRSVAEGDLRTLIRRAGLPAPMYNAQLYVGRQLIAIADAWWPDAGVAAEVDSREWHLSPDDYERTLQRSARMTGHGILMVHLTPKQIRAESETVAAQLSAALMRGRAAPALNIRARPAG